LGEQEIEQETVLKKPKDKGISQRNKNIDEILEIIPPQTKEVEVIPATVEIVSEARRMSSEELDVALDGVAISNELKEELKKDRDKLEQLFELSKTVLESAAEQATSFGKSRDTEAFAKLVDSVVKVRQEIKDVNVKMFEKEKPTPEGAKTHNIIFNGSFRELLKDINDSKTKKKKAK
jgi:hypothetical protein